MLRAELDPLEEAGRALEPAAGDRALAAKDEVIVGEPDRQHRRPPRVSLPAAEPVGALARLEAGGHVLDPPRGPAQALQRLDRLARLELPLEDRPRLLPRPAGERGFARPDPPAEDAISAISQQYPPAIARQPRTTRPRQTQALLAARGPGPWPSLPSCAASWPPGNATSAQIFETAGIADLVALVDSREDAAVSLRPRNDARLPRAGAR